MQEQQVFIGDLTRREFREALAGGKFQTAIIPTGSIEQHLEHPGDGARHPHGYTCR